MNSAPAARDTCTDSCCAPAQKAGATVFWLQGVTLAWMLVECGVSLYAAYAAHSVALLAFGSDSLVELLSAVLVLGAAVPALGISAERASRWAGVLLLVLTVVVGVAAVAALLTKVETETSPLGIAVSVAALIVMPTLAWAKRRQARKTGNRALAADAVQSTACAWLAGGTLLGLAAHALFHWRWIDSVAALLLLPLLVVEARRALRGDPCGCC